MPRLADLLRDIRHAGRLLLKALGYTVAAVMTLALAVGANSAIFGVVHAVLLQPIPIQHPEDLVVAWDSAPSRSLSVVEVSYRRIERWAAQSRSFSHMAAIGSSLWPAILLKPGEPSRVSTSGVSGPFFDLMGARALLGRTLEPRDDVANAPGVAVL